MTYSREGSIFKLNQTLSTNQGQTTVSFLHTPEAIFLYSNCIT